MPPGKAVVSEYLDHRKLSVTHDVHCGDSYERVYVVLGLEISPDVNEEQFLMCRYDMQGTESVTMNRQ